MGVSVPWQHFARGDFAHQPLSIAVIIGKGWNIWCEESVLEGVFEDVLVGALVGVGVVVGVLRGFVDRVSLRVC